MPHGSRSDAPPLPAEQAPRVPSLLRRDYAPDASRRHCVPAEAPDLNQSTPGEDVAHLARERLDRERLRQERGARRHAAVGEVGVADVAGDEEEAGLLPNCTLNALSPAAGGALKATYRYDPYGIVTAANNDTGHFASDFGYTGGRRLTGGLIHLRARAYNPALRQFMQADNVDSNRYLYAGGDPINFVDPSGHRATMMAQYDCEKCGGGWAFMSAAGDTPWAANYAQDVFTSWIPGDAGMWAAGNTWQDASGAGLFDAAGEPATTSWTPPM